MMNRRHLLLCTGLSLVTSRAGASPLQITPDGTDFRAWHHRDRLHCAFRAPTSGWLAVGFNTARRLRDTRMVMGARTGDQTRIEEHIALVPTHPRVQERGLKAAVQDGAVNIDADGATLRFSLPHHFEDTDTPVLLPGQSTHLMLAWSQQADFAHHSAWRRHFDIRL